MIKQDEKIVEGYFEVKKVTNFEELAEGQTIRLPESDLCFQNENKIVQLKYHRPEEDKKVDIKPGIYRLVETPAGVNTAKTEFVGEPLLTSIDNTTKIIGEARKFFGKLHVYERLGRKKKRSVLLYSKPGMGKTQAIIKFCNDFVVEDPGTVVLVWPTSEIDADSITRFLSIAAEPTAECTRMVLIIEDIGGSERDGDRGPSPVDSGLLNLLDGVGITFKLPTFIVATTNHPENLLESLADRPGRFDLMLQLAPPSFEQRCDLLKFIAKREITDLEREALKLKGVENFSVAHMGEVVVRAELDDKTVPDVIKELIAHTERFKKNFEDKRGLGLGI